MVNDFHADRNQVNPEVVFACTSMNSSSTITVKPECSIAEARVCNYLLDYYYLLQIGVQETRQVTMAYPASEPFDEGVLPVSEIHTL